jgi:hypothetical protein
MEQKEYSSVQDNPFAPPSQVEAIELSLDAIKVRVSRPATALIIMSSIHAVFVSITLIASAWILIGGGSLSWDSSVELLIATIQFLSLITIAIGAAKLGFLESYRLAKIGALLSCVPIITPFLLLGIPFGIWALLLLADPRVRNAFPDRNKVSS